ncbi:MAG: hypothetical protein ABJB97_03325 [Acidobacteriota bacterium]
MGDRNQIPYKTDRLFATGVDDGTALEIVPMLIGTVLGAWIYKDSAEEH